MWFLPIFTIAALIHQMSLELDLPVPSPGGLNPSAPPFVPQGFEPGVRVANLSSRVGESAMHSHAPTKTCTKASEVWAMFGYGQLVHQSRIRRIKRSFRRACKRALQAGHTSYHGRCFTESDVPFRLRGPLKAEIQRSTLQPPTRPAKQSGVVLKILSWNATRSLSYHEWLAWATGRPEDILLIQESNWKFNGQWETEHWYCIHSQEAAASQLIMVRKTLIRASMLAYAVLIPGRLLHLRLMLDRVHDVYTIYQTAWSTTKSSRALLQERQDLWGKLRQCIHHTPQSHMMVVIGDFNCPLQRDSHSIGSHDPRFEQALQTDKHDFQLMIRELPLVAVHCKQKYVPAFLHGSHQTRIDFAFMRSNQIRWKHITASIDCRFERIGLHQGPQHRPLLLSLPRWHPIRSAPSKFLSIDRFRLRQEMIADTTAWRHFVVAAQSCILRHQSPNLTCPIENCYSMEHELRELCLEHFPRQKKPFSTDKTVVSLTTRMWHARRLARQVLYVHVRSLFHSWKHLTIFARLHAQIRKFGKINKRLKLEQFLKDNVPHALSNRMHDWYRNIRKLCPKQPSRKIQLHDRFGAPLLPHQELAVLVDHFGTMFHDEHFELAPAPLNSIPFTQDQVAMGLSKLPATKALAPDGMPGLIWKVFAHDIAAVVYPAIECAWTQSGIPPSRWATGWLHLLSKPNKPPNHPAALRPICLQHPVSKVLSGIHCEQVLDHALPSLCRVPLYAYLPHRGTQDCLLLTSEHCRQVKALCQHHKSDPLKSGLWGGLQVSLDLEKAFDAIDRNLVLRAIQRFEMNPDLQLLVQSWQHKHKYCIPHKDLIGHVTASRGIKQGSKDAPLLWTLSMYLLLDHLMASFDLPWIISHIVIYADDIHLRWLIDSSASGLSALHDLTVVLGTLKAFHFRVNLTKSVAIMRLVGKSAPAFLKRWTSRTKEGPRLHLPDQSLSLPLVGKTDYLGVTLSYRAFDHDTVVRRVKAANVCFRILRKWLLDQHHPLTIRLRLYNQCVLPTVSYGIHEMGISTRNFQMIIGMITRHHRTMARSPVHLTREPNTAFYSRMHIEPPWCYLVRQQTRLHDSLSRRREILILEAMQTGQQDICVLTPAYPDTQWQHEPSASPSFSQAPELKCPECDRAFHQAGPWKRHMRTAHQIPCHIEDLFDPLRDSYEGKATCRHCHRQFADIYRLRYHINTRVCLQFDPHKETIVPIADRQSLRMHLRYKSIPGILLDKALVCEIAHHCVFCHLAVPARSIRKHYGERHQGLLVYEALHRDQVYGLANLGSGKGTCVLCAQQCNDVRTHQCGVLLQISILLGQTYDVSHFPVMPTMMRPLRTSRPSSGAGNADKPETPSEAAPLAPQSDTRSIPMEVDADTEGVGQIARTTPLFKCLACKIPPS